jgi:hypothetical protein
MTNQVHLRRIDLERLSAGEAVADASHLAHCDACAAAVESIRLEARTFVQRRPAATVLEQVRARRAPWWRRWWPVVAVSLAAGLAFLVFTGAPDEVRFKGTSFAVLVNGVVPLVPGVAVHAGDELSFVVESSRAGHVLVLDVETGRPVHAFVPSGGQRSMAIGAGRTVLPDGVRLDDAAVPEWVALLFCEGAVSLEDLELTAPAGGAAPVIRHEGCRVQVLSITRSVK